MAKVVIRFWFQSTPSIQTSAGVDPSPTQKYKPNIGGVGVVPKTRDGSAPLPRLPNQTHGRRCSRASSPRAWARSRRSGLALRLVLYAPSSSLRGTGGEVSVTPIERVANYGFLVELLSGDSSGRPCPHSIRVGSWSGDSSMKAIAWVS
jgi:hypothetical protein